MLGGGNGDPPRCLGHPRFSENVSERHSGRTPSVATLPQSETPRKLVLALVAFACCATLLIAARPAAASTTKYCGTLVSPNSACGGWLWYQFGSFFNEAEYPGSGTVSVCEHAYLGYGNGGTTISRRCANNGVGSYEDLYYYYDVSDEVSTFVGNNSGTTHTIDGYAEN
jgi:hypothetical protein